MLGTLLAASLMVQTPAPPRPALACDPVPGSTALLDKPGLRFVIVGELHGTAEAPATFADLVCAAAARKPVNVGVEVGKSFEAPLNAFLASDGGQAARQGFLTHPFWTQPFKDGRSSQAMLAMFDELRRLRQAGRDVRVFGFQPESGRLPPGFDQSYSELEMAQLLSRGAQAKPEALTLVLVGNLHAHKTGLESWGGGLPAAAHLSPKDVISLLVTSSGGTAWNCQSRPGKPEVMCGSHPTRGSEPAGRRGVFLEPQQEGAYDGVLSVGPVTASPPAQP